MSNYQPKEGTGSLFKNEKKTAENQPDYRGDFMINGTLYEFAGWAKEAKNGKKFISMKISTRELHADKKEEPANDGMPF